MDIRGIVFVACSVILLLVVETSSAKEFYAAVSGLEVLLNTTKQIINSVNEYLRSEREILAKITRVKEEYESFYDRANGEKRPFLENSFNQYLLIKRLTADWRNLQQLIVNRTTTGREIVQDLVSRRDLEWPDDGDLFEVEEAVIRLQETYGLNTTDIVRGIVLKSSFAFNADDCEEIGDWAYVNEEFELAVSWLREALLRKTHDDPMLRNNVTEIVKKMLHSAYLSENRTESLLMVAELADLGRSEEEVDDDDDATALRTDKIQEFTNLLCRGHRLMDPSKEKYLHCRQQVSGHPYLLLQHVKEEELHMDPRVVIYHDIISEREIEIIKELAEVELQVAGIGYGGHHRRGDSAVRVSKTAWLNDHIHEVLPRLNQRISDITGLATDTAEALQVANYGTGGHFDAHYDYFHSRSEPEYRMSKSDERIATWLNYMSDVEQGGATVFPRLGIRVQPEKGSALFWYNLRKSGRGDIATLHGACPVLAGSKWASNKWLSETGQEFRRPCSLNPSE